jgi:NDP-sugar pyrophosphorylase family protein
MKKPTLLILAAGMASRYGSMKQTEGFGPNGETIMDYSIYDAIRAGFGKVVFIIRKDFASAFQSAFDQKLKNRIEVEYVYQEMDAFTDDFQCPEARVKPWGTGHAILCAMEQVHEPFAVINADDFYGADAYIKAVGFLNSQCTPQRYAIIGYPLSKTLSDHGTVSRGVCEVDDNGLLISIKERTKIFREDEQIVCDENGILMHLSESASVSMNFWCFHPDMFNISRSLFAEFLRLQGHELKSEFFIPIIADDFIKRPDHAIVVVPTSSSWFGVTYKEDAPLVQANIQALIAQELYPAKLWS